MTRQLPRIFTAAEAAERLHMTKWEVTRRCRLGEITASKPAKSWLITEDALVDFLEKNVHQRESA